MPVRIARKTATGDATVSQTLGPNIGQTIEMNQLFSISEIAEAIIESPPTPSFIKDTLFGNIETWWGETVVIDFLRGNTRVAPFVSEYKRGTSIPRDKYLSKWVKPPHIKVTRDIRVLDARYRSAGESPFSRTSTQERIAALQALDYDDLDQQITRREELMCCEILHDGRLVLIDGDDLLPLGEVNFGPMNETAISPLWDEPDSQPLRDLKAMQRLVASSGYPCNAFVLGGDASDAFLNNPTVKESSNFLNYRQGVIDVQTYQDYENFGVTVLGNFQGLNIVSYEGLYTDPIDRKQHFYFPPNRILCASTLNQHRMTYSHIAQVQPGSYPPVIEDFQLQRVPQYVSDAKEDALLFRLWSRPLPVLTNTFSFTTARVCRLVSKPFELPEV